MKDARKFDEQATRFEAGSGSPPLHAVPGDPGRGCSWSRPHSARRLALPVLLIDLDDFTVRAASDSVHSLDDGRLAGRFWPAFVAAEDRRPVEMALEAMKHGAIDVAVRRTRPPHHENGTPPLTGFVVRRTELGDGQSALVYLDSGQRQDPVWDSLGSATSAVVVGTVDSSWRITSSSDGSTDLMELTPDQLIGRFLVAPDQRHSLNGSSDHQRTEDTGFSLALGVSFNDLNGTEHQMCCLVTPLATSRGRVFILIPDEPEVPTDELAGRIAQLEQHLWSIAGEVQATGILRHMDPLPELSGLAQVDNLSTRQWEVLSRLVRGERVPTIASALFVSQSTVRNCLSAIYKRFGVHSQAQLLSLLASRDTPPNGDPDVLP